MRQKDILRLEFIIIQKYLCKICEDNFQDFDGDSKLGWNMNAFYVVPVYLIIGVFITGVIEEISSSSK